MARKPRLSLTKAQLESAAGAELLALCQSITSDGLLVKDEIIELTRWLRANRSSDLPSIAFLIATVEQIISDGKVTRREQMDLYKAVETILPPEVRKQAAGQRRIVEAKVEAHERRGAAEQKSAAADKKRRNARIYKADFMVAGVHYEGRGDVIRKHVRDLDTVYLARDRANKRSQHAIEVRLDLGFQIGFVPEEYAEELAPLLDQGYPHRAHVKKILIGAPVPIPVVIGEIYPRESDHADLVLEAAVPAKVF